MSKNEAEYLSPLVGFPFNYEYYWVLTRKPLSVKSAQFKTVFNRAKTLVKKQNATYDFEEKMRSVKQTEKDLGANVIYPKDV